MIYFTADWHAGEARMPNTHSFLRPHDTPVMVEMWLKQCWELLHEEDTLVFVGDLAITLDDLEVYRRLPKCKKILVLGDKEYANKNFTLEEFMKRIKELQIFDEVVKETVVEVREIQFFLSHKPSECLSSGTAAVCGHVHGIWRTSRMPNGMPIVNVGIDAWGGLVSEEMLLHQYGAVLRHYDEETFPQDWK